MRFAARRDENEREIVDALRGVGASVHRLDGPGLPDLLVGRAGETYLLEVKRPAGPRGGVKGRTLTAPQVQFQSEWRGRKAVVVADTWQALEAVGIDET